MALPRPATRAPAVAPLERSITARGALSQGALSSYNYFSGSAAGDALVYSDLASFTWWIPLIRVCVEAISVVCLDRKGNVVDRIVPGSGEVGVLPGTKWTLANSPGELIGGCLTADVVVPRPLKIEPKGSIIIELVDGNNIFTRVYRGRVDRPPVNTTARDTESGEMVDAFRYHCVGWKAFANDIVVLGERFEAVDVGEMFRELVRDHLSAKTLVGYNPDKIADTGYVAVRQDFMNTRLLNALDTLAQLAGEYVWGVDVEGDAYLQPRQVHSDHHFWIDRHPITIDSLDRDTDNIKNVVYVETTVEDQGRVYYQVADEHSIDEWGRVEEVVQMPTSAITFENVIISSATGSKEITDVDNLFDQQQFTYAEFPDAQVDDYIDVGLNNPADLVGLILRQGSDQGDGSTVDPASVTEIEIQSIDGTVLHTATGLGNDVRLDFSNHFASALRLVVKSAPSGGSWYIREIQLITSDLSDPARYGQTLLDLWKEPVLVGSATIHDGCFITPTGIRVTDATGETYKFDVDQMEYTVESTGLVVKASVGKGHLNLQRAIALTSDRGAI